MLRLALLHFYATLYPVFDGFKRLRGVRAGEYSFSDKGCGDAGAMEFSTYGQPGVADSAPSFTVRLVDLSQFIDVGGWSFNMGNPGVLSGPHVECQPGNVERCVQSALADLDMACRAFAKEVSRFIPSSTQSARAAVND